MACFFEQFPKLLEPKIEAISSLRRSNEGRRPSGGRRRRSSSHCSSFGCSCTCSCGNTSHIVVVVVGPRLRRLSMTLSS